MGGYMGWWMDGWIGEWMVDGSYQIIKNRIHLQLIEIFLCEDIWSVETLPQIIGKHMKQGYALPSSDLTLYMDIYGMLDINFAYI